MSYLEYHRIYTLKAICALFVVIYHFGGIYANELIPITNVAVPIFFIISGFFLYSNDKKREIDKALKWTKKTLILFILLNIFYYLCTDKFGTYYTSKDWIFIIFHGGVISSPLWYLAALWEALLIFYFLRKILNERYFQQTLVLAPSLFILSLAIGRYNSYIFNNEIYSQWLEKGFLSVAIPCLSLGYLLAKYPTIRNNNILWLILSLLFLLFIFLEDWFLSPVINGGYYLWSLPLGIAIICVCLDSNNAKASFLSSIGKKHASNVYFFHMFIGLLLIPILPDFLEGFQSLAIYLLCILFSSILIFLGNIIKSLLPTKKRLSP